MIPKCNLIIDSCCDLPYEVVQCEGVDLIEFPYTMDGESYIDDFYRSTTPARFYDAMRAGACPSTSQLALNVLEEAFMHAVESGIPTVFLCFGSALSGSYDSACLMRDRIIEKHPDAELYVVDTLLASVAEGLLVYEAIGQRAKGLTATELVAWAEEARWFVNAQFMLDDLEALRRGGRIPAGVAMAGAKLDVKPLLGFDLTGKLSLAGVSRGRKKGIKALAEYYIKRVDADTAEGADVVLANADCEKDQDRLMEMLGKLDHRALFLETSIGPVIGSHVGPGMLAIVFWGPDRREDLSVADRIAKRVKN